MSFCIKCGNEIIPGKKFCRHCGTPAITISNGARCPACKTETNSDDKFCKSCGFLLKPVPVRADNKPPEIPAYERTISYSQPVSNPPEDKTTGIPPPFLVPKQGKKKGYFGKILIILALLIGIGAIALYFSADLFDKSGTNATGELTGTDIPGIVSITDSISGNNLTQISSGNPLEVAELTEKAFASADTNLLKQILTAQSLETYSAAFKEIQPYMAEYAKAFGNRKLVMSNNIYAVYSFTDETGTKYTAEFALGDEGKWKLIRF